MSSLKEGIKKVTKTVDSTMGDVREMVEGVREVRDVLPRPIRERLTERLEERPRLFFNEPPLKPLLRRRRREREAK